MKRPNLFIVGAAKAELDLPLPSPEYYQCFNMLPLDETLPTIDEDSASAFANKLRTFPKANMVRLCREFADYLADNDHADAACLLLETALETGPNAVKLINQLERFNIRRQAGQQVITSSSHTGTLMVQANNVYYCRAANTVNIQNSLMQHRQ
jgi:hypothetical protein